MTCMRNFDQSTGIYSQIYTYDFPGTTDKLLIIQIPYQSQTIKSTTKKNIMNLDQIVVGCPSQENNNYLNKKPPVPTPHIRNTPLKALLRTLTPPTVEKCVSPTSPLLVLSTPKKHEYFRIYKTFDLNMKIQFKTTRGKGQRIPSRTTAGGSSPFPWSVWEVDSALRSLSVLPVGIEEAYTAPP